MTTIPQKPDIHIDGPSGFCPVQAEGTVDGMDVYFRARGEGWELVIAESDAVGASLGLSPALYHRICPYGVDGEGHPVTAEILQRVHTITNLDLVGVDAGWMPHDEARAMIERCLVEYLAGERGQFVGEPPSLALDEATQQPRHLMIWRPEDFVGMTNPD